jgi:P-type Cu+ transporter
MHREISHTDSTFEQESRLSLYLLTGLLGVVLAADLWPILVRWLGGWGSGLPSWSNEIGSYRLALIAAVIGGARILYGALDALFAGRVGADLALALACVAAILLREPLVAAEVVFIGMLGECLENFTFERTQKALRGLVRLRPRRCWRLRDGQEEAIDTSELAVGDRVVVKPGRRVPADGVVLEGRSTLDVSALTGESLPLDRAPGDEVLAGSLNQMGALTISVHKVGEETVVGRVLEMTSQALKDKAPLERTADRLARYFLPAVLGLAAVTFLAGVLIYTTGWLRVSSAETARLGLIDAARLSLYPALSVLVVACPCALILATPAAIIAALGRLAGTGILIKRASALERLAHVNVLAFDKTGTLTEGQLQLGDIVPLGNTTAEQLLQIAASAEQSSEHILARLILNEARRRNLPLEPFSDFQAHPGCGVSGRVPAGKVLVGNPRLMRERNLILSAEVEAILAKMDEAGQTVLLVALEDTILGAIGASDRVRPEAPGVLRELRQMGIAKLAMLTGDRAAVAQAVARQLETEQTEGLLEIHAELLPHQKAEWVEKLTAEDAEKNPRKGKQAEDPAPTQVTASLSTSLTFPAPSTVRGSVGMVGDGINDAPALARADVGLAIAASGVDLAAEAGDIIFMGEPLRSLPMLIRLSRETVRIIRQNILIFAFGVNAVGIVLTSWLWPVLMPAAWYEQSPVAAVIYHQIGSLAVLLNAMRLLWFERAPSAAAGKMQEKIKGINDWLERWFNVDEGLHWLLHHWRGALAGVLGLFVLGFALAGLNQIAADEIGIVQRFGKLLPDDLTPGLHWRWPSPIETVTRVQPDRIQSLPIGYRLAGGSNVMPGARSWSSEHGQDGLLRVPEEAVIITGDGNLIELQGSLRYRIDQPRVWLFEVSDGPAILRSAAESVLREAVGNRTFSDLLTSGRSAFQDDVLQRLRERCEGYHTKGLGIRLEGLSLHDMHPPQEVVAAYHEVTKAMERRDQRVNVAQANALAREQEQQGQSLKTIREAESARHQTLALAQARQEAFRARWQARNRLDWSLEFRFLGEAVSTYLASRPIPGVVGGPPPLSTEEVARGYGVKRNDALALQMHLTDFRLYWDMLTTTLTGREKVIVDAEKVSGRRHLWLMPPDLFRLAPRTEK